MLHVRRSMDSGEVRHQDPHGNIVQVLPHLGIGISEKPRNQVVLLYVIEGDVAPRKKYLRVFQGNPPLIPLRPECAP